jgi:MFS family permease
VEREPRISGPEPVPNGARPRSQTTSDTRQPRAAGAAGAYIFFATLYFVQSVGDPTSGLVAQPVRSLLNSWGESPAAIGALMAFLAVPWMIKPAFGLLSDFVPLFGSRRRNYLLMANGGAALSLLLLALVPIAPGSLWLLFALLLPTTMASALGDVIVDALMVEKGQRLGLTGRFQSIQWAAGNAALLLAGVLGGYVAEKRLQSVAFALCGALWVFAFAVAWCYAGDHEDAHLDTASLRETSAALLGVLRDKCLRFRSLWLWSLPLKAD